MKNVEEPRDAKGTLEARANRREALKRLGKYAIVTAPAVLATLKAKNAAAVQYGPPRGNP